MRMMNEAMMNEVMVMINVVMKMMVMMNEVMVMINEVMKMMVMMNEVMK